MNNLATWSGLNKELEAIEDAIAKYFPDLSMEDPSVARVVAQLLSQYRETLDAAHKLERLLGITGPSGPR